MYKGSERYATRAMSGSNICPMRTVIVVTIDSTVVTSFLALVVVVVIVVDVVDVVDVVVVDVVVVVVVVGHGMLT